MNYPPSFLFRYLDCNKSCFVYLPVQKTPLLPLNLSRKIILNQVWIYLNFFSNNKDPSLAQSASPRAKTSSTSVHQTRALVRTSCVLSATKRRQTCTSSGMKWECGTQGKNVVETLWHYYSKNSPGKTFLPIQRNFRLFKMPLLPLDLSKKKNTKTLAYKPGLNFLFHYIERLVRSLFYLLV